MFPFAYAILFHLFSSQNILQQQDSNLVTQRSLQGDHPLQELFTQSHATYEGWSNGTLDASEAIGTFLVFANDHPTDSGYFRFTLAKALQAEGRTVEAAHWYWMSCHVPTRTLKYGDDTRPSSTRNPYSRNIDSLARIVDALEDAQRSDDVASLLKSEGINDVQELYLMAIAKGSMRPEWLAKFALKLKKRFPNDLEIAKIAEKVCRRATEWSSHPDKYVPTRDVPR